MYDTLADAPEMFPTPRLDAMSVNARKVFEDRYVRKDPVTSKPVETIRGTMWRVASAVAEAHPDDQGARTVRYFQLLSEMRMLPNSPTFTGAGTRLGNLSACFVLPIEDDMGGHPDGIFQSLRNAALIQKTGGGNGFSFSRLRAKGQPVHSSAGKASGPVSFLQVFNAAFSAVNQGGARRGANMGVMRVDHPDIREFVHSKNHEGDIANFNISVALTDAFMKAVTDDEYFDLIEPSTGDIIEIVRARELFDEIVDGAYRNGEPGALFIDEANRHNPVAHLGAYEATNPCAEQWLLPYESCNLGCINLTEHLRQDEDGDVTMDWEKLEETIRLSVQFLDDVVEVNRYVDDVPQLRAMALSTRRIGLGLMGLADVLICLGLRYDSMDALEFASELMEFIRYNALDESVTLAKAYGPFPAINGSVYSPEGGQWERPEAAHRTRGYSLFGRPDCDWGLLELRVRSNGVRNATQTTIAPTGTRATVADCEGYGCEPIFSLAYTRKVTDIHSVDGTKVELAYHSRLLEAALVAYPDATDDVKHEWLNAVAETGSCQKVDGFPFAIAWPFVVAGDIRPSAHISMQATLQLWVDSSISKTINMPADSTLLDVKQAYVQAWSAKCKGITVYVENSRKEVVLETIKPVVKEATGDCTDEVCTVCG